MNMDTIFKGVGRLTTLVVFALLLIAAKELQRSEHAMGVYVVTADEAEPAWVNGPSTMTARFPLIGNQYNEICWRNMDTDNTRFVYISTFSTVDESASSWVVAGTEKECHDWTGNIPLWIFRDASDPADVSMRFMFVR